MAFNPTKTLANIFRRYVIDGNPASGENKPRKSEIATWGTEVEAKFNSVDSAVGDVAADVLLLDGEIDTLAGVVAGKLDAHPPISGAGPSSNPGDSFVIDAITVDSFGHVTAIGTRQVVSTATTSTVTDYPRGWPITVLRSKLESSFILNQAATIYVSNTSGATAAFATGGAGFTALVGTWRCAGYCGVDLSGDFNLFLFVRTL